MRAVTLRPAAVLLVFTLVGAAAVLVVHRSRVNLAAEPASPELVATAYDPYASELLAPYGALRDAMVAGDAGALQALAFDRDDYVAYLAAAELASWETQPAAERRAALERQLALRVDDPLRRAEATDLTLRLAQLSEAAGDAAAAEAAYRDALPDERAVAALERLEQDPYRLAAALQAAGLHRAALEALGERTAPSIEAPSLRALGRYEEALDAYRRWRVEAPGNETAALGEAWCLYYLGRYDDADAAFATLGAAGDYGRGLIANRRGDVDRAVALLASTGRADLLWLASGLLEARDRYADVLGLYLRLARGGSAYADDAAYRAVVLARRLEMPEVVAEAEALLPRGSFFGLKLGLEPAVPDLTAVELPSPSAGTAAAAEAGARPDSDDAETDPLAAERASAHHAMRVAAALYAVHETDAAVGELLFALRSAERAGDVATVLDLGEMLQSMDEYRQSVRAARALLAEGEGGLRAWRLAYPPAWPETVMAAAERHGVEPHLIWAVMRQESAFSEVAVSRANAQGLMQVVPSTWDWIAELRDEAPGDPFDVHDNVHYGATYLAWLMRYFDGDEELVIASYNGGQGYVRRLYESEWVAGDKDDFYREIDRSETREYLQRVAENLAVYRALYPSLTVVAEAPATPAD